MLRQIGFSMIGCKIKPESAEAFLREYIDQTAYLNRRDPYKPTIVR
jgi:hypothetical protein